MENHDNTYTDLITKIPKYDNLAALIVTVENNNIEIAKTLLDQGENVYVKDELPLIIACGTCNYDMIKLLIEHGADVYCNNCAPFAAAAKHSHYEIIEHFIKIDDKIIR